jgi:hypothetical protein
LHHYLDKTDLRASRNLELILATRVIGEGSFTLLRSGFIWNFVFNQRQDKKSLPDTLYQGYSPNYLHDLPKKVFLQSINRNILCKIYSPEQGFTIM